MNEKHPVDEVLPLGFMSIYGLQHVLAMYAGAVAVPIILAKSLNLTLEQTVFLFIYYRKYISYFA